MQNLRWPRLIWSDGYTLDLPEAVDVIQLEAFEKGWRSEHIKVQWLRSPRGRLDAILERYVSSDEPESTV